MKSLNNSHFSILQSIQVLFEKRSMFLRKNTLCLAPSPLYMRHFSSPSDLYIVQQRGFRNVTTGILADTFRCCLLSLSRSVRLISKYLILLWHEYHQLFLSRATDSKLVWIHWQLKGTLFIYAINRYSKINPTLPW